MQTRLSTLYFYPSMPNMPCDKEEHTMRDMIKMSISMIVILACILGITFAVRVEAGETFPTRLTFTYNRPKTHLTTQWLILIYTEALRRMDIEFVFRDLPSKRASAYSNEGRVDGELSRVYDYNTNHPNLIRVEEHNYFVRFSAFATDSTLTLDGWDSLKNTGYTVEYRLGGKKVSEQLALVVPAERLSEVGTIEQAIKRLFLGRTDVFVAPEDLVMEYINSPAFQEVRQKMGQGNTIHRVGLMEETTGHAWLYKTHRELTQQLAAILREMKAEGLFKVYGEQVGLLPGNFTW